MSETIALAEAHSKELGYEPVMDADFAADVRERIANRKPRDTSAGIEKTGLILDSTVLITAERRGETVRQIALRMKALHGDTPTAISTISVIELTHGIYRARTRADKDRRQTFMDELCRDMIIHPVSLEIAQLVGQIEGEQAAQGIGIPFEDLVIGATASTSAST